MRSSDVNMPAKYFHGKKFKFCCRFTMAAVTSKSDNYAAMTELAKDDISLTMFCWCPTPLRFVIYKNSEMNSNLL